MQGFGNSEELGLFPAFELDQFPGRFLGVPRRGDHCLLYYWQRAFDPFVLGSWLRRDEHIEVFLSIYGQSCRTIDRGFLPFVFVMRYRCHRAAVLSEYLEAVVSGIRHD